MKIIKNNHLVGIVALLIAGILGGLAPISAKVALKELPPLTVLFVRLTIMLVGLIPFVSSSLHHLISHWKKLVIVGLFWSGNVILFIVGIAYTTSLASQILYAGVPIIVLMEQVLVSRKRLSNTQLVGIVLGFIGTIVLVLQGGSVGFGTWYGNAIIFTATLSWAFYLISSKRMSEHVHPVAMTTGAALTAWIISGIAMVSVEGLNGIGKLGVISVSEWEVLLFLGLVIGVLMIFCYQYGIKHGSALAASMNAYVSTLTAGFVGFLWFGEQVTSHLLLGGSLILIGVFLTTVYPLLAKKARA